MTDVSLPRVEEDEPEASAVIEATVPIEVSLLEAEDGKALLLAEFWAQLALSLPMCLFNILQFCIGALGLAITGTLAGAESLAAAALALSFCNVSGVSLVVGISLVLETLCTQAYGAGNPAALGIFLQRALLLNSTIALAVTLVWSQLGNVFVALGQEPAMAALAGAYGSRLIPHLWLLAVQIPVQKVLQAQGVMAPMGAVAACLLAFHVPVTLALVRRFGYLGAAHATCLTDTLALLLTAGYFAWHERRLPPARRCWRGLAWRGAAAREVRDAREIRAYLRLALPTTAMLAVEWWSFEAAVLMAGALRDIDGQGATAVAINMLQVVFSVPLGLAQGASTRVGNALGGGRPAAARLAAVTGVMLATALGATTLTVILLKGQSYGRLFSARGEAGAGVRAAFRRTLPFASIAAAGDAIQTVSSGVIRGCGQQGIGARVNLAAYSLALPLCAGLAFGTKLRAAGLIAGLASATCSQAAMYVTFLFSKVNWETLAREASKSAKAGLPEALGALAENGALAESAAGRDSDNDARDARRRGSASDGCGGGGGLLELLRGKGHSRPAGSIEKAEEDHKERVGLLAGDAADDDV